MNKESQTYRIEISRNSRFLLIYLLVLACLSQLTIWQWPYYTPYWLRTLLSFIIIVLITKEAVEHWRRDASAVLSLSQIGRYVYYSKGNHQAGWLVDTCRSYPDFFCFKYRNDLDNKVFTKIIFTDQLSEHSQRRISRVIQRARLAT